MTFSPAAPHAAAPHAAALEASLALAAEAVGDPTPLVYASLFERHPAMAAEFWRDASGTIRGEMLTRTLEAALDLAGANGVPGGSWAPAFLATEIVTHDSYGIPRGIFRAFLPIVAEVLQTACGDGLTLEMRAAWQAVMAAADDALAAVPAASGEARAIDAADVLAGVGDRGLFFPLR